MKQVVKVRLIGFGTVGTGVVKIMLGNEKPHLRGRNPEFELLRKNLQLVFVWRILPPFGSVQLAYQEGSARHTESDNVKTLFCKVAWIL